ncbi:methylmalonyl Co-A mutase-associated GTPase MeaB [Tumebacillus sp. ITR2]|uniref:Methylmalonyl Co-A mutase-associated GTPase MeaB n=1 Tax=Tumebacillus amylolyticus TaxID=2801339 RepID=A0ABS1J516_9BACL|nr:methylmalonyl Co-A mutase-associated GTPase MeaB [Tumebacillus amylolyticus]MBL0385367.1 methylmalonyl Co-A mutase-associated GTPase MeaB [Tumebacillus amylolyticus]
MHELVARILSGDKRAVARAITHIENDAPEKNQILRDLHPHTGKAFLVGLTGPPGAGKSSLTDRLIGYLRREFDYSIGVVAVDPTSPFTGGAILGDRVRMGTHALDPKVFIRSMGTRGSLGGLSRATQEAIRVLDAYGCDVILIETVGVGQSELDIMNVADSTVVVLNPSAGDHIQTMKAGIMEIADLFAINKADLPGTDKTEREIHYMLDMLGHIPWRPPVVRTISRDNQGCPELWSAIQKHKQHLEDSGLWSERRHQRRQEEIVAIVEGTIARRLKEQINADADWAQKLARVEQGVLDPYQLADEMMQNILKK